MRKKEEAQKKQQVSMPVILAGITALILVAYLYLQPQPSNTAESSQRKPQTASPITKSLSKQHSLGSVTVTQEVNLNEEEIAGKTKDPFLPSESFFIAVHAKQNKVPVNLNQKNSAGDPQLEQLSTEIAKMTATTKGFTWRGTIGSKDDAVALIGYNQKSYILRLGDALPGTDYKVAEIAQDMLILASPKEKIQLDKKKEAN